MKKLLSSEHFSVDGTLIDAWASMKSFRPKDGSGEPLGDVTASNFRNEIHASTTDPDARLYHKADGRESRLCFIGHVLMENHALPHAGYGLAKSCASEEVFGWIKAQAGLIRSRYEDLPRPKRYSPLPRPHSQKTCVSAK